jgi:hypothetical protein
MTHIDREPYTKNNALDDIQTLSDAVMAFNNFKKAFNLADNPYRSRSLVNVAIDLMYWIEKTNET